jgi:hypothetical protein
MVHADRFLTSLASRAMGYDAYLNPEVFHTVRVQ